MIYSFNFPHMLNSASSDLITERDAVWSNLRLLFRSEKATLFGDPYFGSRLRKILFEQNSTLVADLIVDELYTTIITFMPQLILTRKDITLTSNGTDVFATVNCTYIPDNTSNLYVINLTSPDSF